MAHEGPGKIGMLRLVWDAASSPAEGENVCGDAHVVRSLAESYLVVVVDGLGHGPDASVAANAAISAAATNGDDAPSAVIRRCHRACRDTRGVVMTVVRIDPVRGAIRWAGVGNVEAVLVRGRRDGATWRETAMLSGGVVGVALPALKEQEYEVEPGDVLALATDGIRREFVDELLTPAAPSDLAARIIERHHATADDGLVLVARCEGAR